VNLNYKIKKISTHYAQSLLIFGLMKFYYHILYKDTYFNQNSFILSTKLYYTYLRKQICKARH